MRPIALLLADKIASEERWRLLFRVNTDVNEAIRPESDEVHYGRPEIWTIPDDGYGDCDGADRTAERRRPSRLDFAEPANGRHGSCRDRNREMSSATDRRQPGTWIVSLRPV
jgi:hypothetical protein